MRRALIVSTAAAVAALTALAPAGPAASAASGHAHYIGPVRGAHLALNMSQSNNWSGYNKGLLETGRPMQAISGQWVVPAATQAVAKQDEASSTWVGIGGGCLETSCLATDSTLIQAGTEQDVAANGAASYSAWYELIPAPSLPVPLAVHPGDSVSVSISQSVPEVWSIAMKNLTTGGSWSTTVPYPSTYGSAEWIEETPVTIGTGGAGLAAMPRLGTVSFTNATVNGANAALNPAEKMQLVTSSGAVLATPSDPNAARNGFNDCTYASTCPAP